jgi:hypothetical protein
MNIVKKIPEPYRSIAFGVVLKHLLSETSVAVAKQHKLEYKSASIPAIILVNIRI